MVRSMAEAMAKSPATSNGRIALVGETEHDVREVMVEGVSGLLRVHPPRERSVWVAARRRLEWKSGGVAEGFSAEDPESLRGPQFSAAWADEIAKRRHADATFDMLQFGLRLGVRPRQVITTTPRPIALLKRLMADPATVLTRAGTRANAPHLSAAFIDTVFARYGGTRIGRQELDGEIIDQRADALWSRAQIESCRVRAAPPLHRIVVAVDPPASSTKRADACGLVAAGPRRGRDILRDCRRDGVGAFARRLGAEGDRAVATPGSRRAGGRGQSGRRHGARGDRRGRPHGAGGTGARDAYQMAARRARCRALRTGPGETRRRVSGAGR